MSINREMRIAVATVVGSLLMWITIIIVSCEIQRDEKENNVLPYRTVWQQQGIKMYAVKIDTVIYMVVSQPNAGGCAIIKHGVEPKKKK